MGSSVPVIVRNNPGPLLIAAIPAAAWLGWNSYKSNSPVGPLTGAGVGAVYGMVKDQDLLISAVAGGIAGYTFQRIWDWIAS
jgi:hypothetical protein